VRMRIRIIVLLISLLLIGTIQLTADTIVDSVYASNVELSASLFFRQSLQKVLLYLWVIGAGDTGESLIASDPNSIFRGYVSFTLPEIPEGYILDSAFIRLYQEGSVGDGDIWGNQEPYPLFYGVELPCIMDHIEYGNYLDPSDWTKGDPGATGTLHTNIGIISDSAEVSYRYLDITTYVLDDYDSGRDKTQYRIRFEVDTDWDNKSDGLGFTTTGFGPVTAPIIFLYFSYNNFINEEVVPELNNISVYPNPFINSTTISFTARQGQVREIGVYNLKGQLLRTLGFRDSGLGFSTEWDGKDESGHDLSNGIYLVRIESKNVNVIRKVMKLK